MAAWPSNSVEPKECRASGTGSGKGERNDGETLRDLVETASRPSVECARGFSFFLSVNYPSEFSLFKSHLAIWIGVVIHLAFNRSGVSISSLFE
jgi:hypothetical protein